MTLDTVWSALGWVAAGLNICGNLALTTKGLRGWIIRIACNLCWLPYGIYTKAWALLANHLLFVAINAYGYWKWRRDELSVDTTGEVPRVGEAERRRREAYIKGFNEGRIAERRSRRISW
jgi:hypothetical protein